MPSFSQCFICREWSWSVSKSYSRVDLCLPCYVDVLEVRQARGVMGRQGQSSAMAATGEGPEPEAPGNSPSPTPDPAQLELASIGDMESWGLDRASELARKALGGTQPPGQSDSRRVG